MSACYHCGLPADSNFQSDIQGESRLFCCLGCVAVAQAIESGGLADFYQYRDQQSPKADEKESAFSAFDLAAVESTFVRVLPSSRIAPMSDTAEIPSSAEGYLGCEATFRVNNIVCSACAWLIENYLAMLPGVSQVNVNVGRQTCRVEWDKGQVPVSELMRALHRIGYAPQPYEFENRHHYREQESRQSLIRLGVAGVGMMQVGMIAIALYAGDAYGMGAQWQQLLRWVSLLITAPILIYSAKPFWLGAWRSLHQRFLTMDVPIALALILAFCASTWATVSQTGHVYFDSVSMFTFFLLLGRFLEMRARHRSAEETEKLTALMPKVAERYSENGQASEAFLHKTATEMVPLSALKPGDVIRVDAGSTMPCDGCVVEGISSADEALLTGESQPVKKRVGDPVYAGSSNQDMALAVRVTSSCQNTTLAFIERLMDKATEVKPTQLTLIDRIAGYFVAAVLIMASVSAFVWWQIDTTYMFWVPLSILVVTCPCALSLATPTVLTVAMNRLRHQGVLVQVSSIFEALSQVQHVIFDKTGTLTEGSLRFTEILPLEDLSDHSTVEQIVASLEKNSTHPIARAFHSSSANLLSVANARNFPGEGVMGDVGGVRYAFGRLEFITREFSNLDVQALAYPGEGLWQLLATASQPIAWICFEDMDKPGVGEILSFVKSRGLTTHLLSGDRQENVNVFSERFRFDHINGDCKPEEKLEYVQSLQQRGQVVCMIGDGINDAPVLSGAGVSVAVGNSSQLAQMKADAVLLNHDIRAFTLLLSMAQQVKRKIRQNIGWAIGYNIFVLPAAAMGYIPPYLAAIGMSLSSLIVVLNASRVGRDASCLGGASRQESTHAMHLNDSHRLKR